MKKKEEEEENLIPNNRQKIRISCCLRTWDSFQNFREQPPSFSIWDSPGILTRGPLL